jgi:hypothetical protein
MIVCKVKTPLSQAEGLLLEEYTANCLCIYPQTLHILYGYTDFFLHIVYNANILHHICQA